MNKSQIVTSDSLLQYLFMNVNLVSYIVLQVYSEQKLSFYDLCQVDRNSSFEKIHSMLFHTSIITLRNVCNFTSINLRY